MELESGVIKDLSHVLVFGINHTVSNAFPALTLVCHSDESLHCRLSGMAFTTYPLKQ